jgi:hypothetical protein
MLLELAHEERFLLAALVRDDYERQRRPDRNIDGVARRELLRLPNRNLYGVAARLRTKRDPSLRSRMTRAKATARKAEDRPLTPKGRAPATANEKAGPSPFRASRVWAQDDDETQRHGENRWTQQSGFDGKTSIEGVDAASEENEERGGTFSGALRRWHALAQFGGRVVRLRVGGKAAGAHVFAIF